MLYLGLFLPNTPPPVCITSTNNASSFVTESDVFVANKGNAGSNAVTLHCCNKNKQKKKRNLIKSKVYN